MLRIIARLFWWATLVAWPLAAPAAISLTGEPALLPVYATVPERGAAAPRDRTGFDRLGPLARHAAARGADRLGPDAMPPDWAAEMALVLAGLEAPAPEGQGASWSDSALVGLLAAAALSAALLRRRAG